MGHDLDVKWSPEKVSPEKIGLADWECWTDSGDPAITYAKGPCPACGATVQGASPGGTVPLPEVLRLEVDVFIECNCGYDHSKDGALGCGRLWGIQCPADSRE
jgi:hypothetical protein